jgi:hypothetical protein
MLCIVRPTVKLLLSLAKGLSHHFQLFEVGRSVAIFRGQYLLTGLEGLPVQAGRLQS